MQPEQSKHFERRRVRDEVRQPGAEDHSNADLGNKRGATRALGSQPSDPKDDQQQCELCNL